MALFNGTIEGNGTVYRHYRGNWHPSTGNVEGIGTFHRPDRGNWHHSTDTIEGIDTIQRHGIEKWHYSTGTIESNPLYCTSQRRVREAKTLGRARIIAHVSSCRPLGASNVCLVGEKPTCAVPA